jgi:site-specific DNA-methyltransferase (adenine-specific)
MMWIVCNDSEITNIKYSISLYNDSSEKMDAIDSESVACIVTSPPYFNYINYGGVGIGSESVYSDYINNLKKVFTESYRVLLKGGTFCMNITNMKSRVKTDKSSFLHSIAADVTKLMQNTGFIFFDEIVWIKADANNGALKGKPLFGSYPYPPTPKILDSIFENILIFKKPGKRIPMPKEIKEKSKLTKEEWQVFTKGIWNIIPDRKAKHPATFPLEIPYRLIKMYSFVDDLILDPFSGSGTTLLASYKLNRRAVGFEINEGYVFETMERFNVDAYNKTKC